MATCVRCGKDAGIIGSLGFNKQNGRCGKCDGEIGNLLKQFRQQFIQACSDGLITSQEWFAISTPLAQQGISIAEALAYVRGDALHFLERSLAFASADGYITEEEEKTIYDLKNFLQIPDNVAQTVLQRLTYLRYISNIRMGKLPSVRPSVVLDTDEICHLEMNATYYKINAKSVTQIPGRLVATSKKLNFLSATGGNESTWKSVMRVEQQQGGVYIEMSKKTGNGYYNVPDPVLVEAVLDTLIRLDKRQLTSPNSDAATRRIPHDVRVAVWSRDQGKCVECGDQSYLEFDPIIPFSKGGASTTNNVQLLCRRCNLKKGDRL